MKSSYYSSKKIDATGATYRLIIGQRSNGKTFDCCRKIIDEYIDHGIPSAYIRRMDEMIKPSNIQNLFRPHHFDLQKDGTVKNYIDEKTEHKYNSITYWRRAWYLFRVDTDDAGRTIKTAQDKHSQKADTISYYNNFVVLLLFALFAVSRGDLAALKPSETPGFWWLAALGGLAQTGIYFFYYRNLKRHEVWVVKLWLLLMPVLSCIVGVLFLNEEPTVWKLVGIGVVLIGAGIILLRGKLHPEEKPKKEDA